MGFQTMGSRGGNQKSHLQQQPPPPPPPPIIMRESSSLSWYNLTLDEVEKQLLRDSGKSLGLGSMNLDELLNTVCNVEPNQSTNIIDADSSCSASSLLQRQASLSLARALSGKTVDEVWRDIQHGQKKRLGDQMIKSETEEAFGEITLEDFLVKAGIFAEASFGPVDDDRAIRQNLMQRMSLSPSVSTGTLSDTTTSGRKRDATDALENTIDRRLRRKIKNRESAARSRARKQAYHDELVNKVSRLEEQNIRLKKEKELENMLPCESPSEPKYQLRRTSSTCF